VGQAIALFAATIAEFGEPGTRTALNSPRPCPRSRKRSRWGRGMTLSTRRNCPESTSSGEPIWITHAVRSGVQAQCMGWPPLCPTPPIGTRLSIREGTALHPPLARSERHL